ncbi:hypothetical protein LXL04_001543 [Taraxacum kok-saghyz]
MNVIFHRRVDCCFHQRVEGINSFGGRKLAKYQNALNDADRLTKTLHSIGFASDNKNLGRSLTNIGKLIKSDFLFYKNKLKLNKTYKKSNSGILHEFKFHFLRTKQTLELIPIPFHANQTAYGIGFLFLIDSFSNSFSFSISNILRTKRRLIINHSINEYNISSQLHYRVQVVGKRAHKGCLLMAAFAASFLSCASSRPSLSFSSSLALRGNQSVTFPGVSFRQLPKGLVNVKTLVFASSDGFRAHEGDSRSKRAVLLKLIQEIEPLDVSIIQRDVPPTTIDAMKRTISGMLGLLPSDQFQVLIEALWKPLSKLLVSSLMTGYTLRNAEYRLCLERNFDTDEETSTDKQTTEDSSKLLHNNITTNTHESDKSSENPSEFPDLGQMTPELQQYIHKLQSRLFSVKKELHEVKRKNAALQMQQFVGEEKNELLDYLRSLQPEKVAELSEPTSADLKETIHSVVHGLLATLSPKMHSQPPHVSETESTSLGIGTTDVVENTSIQFQPIISLSRDYLARLLFWCMLVGHYLRGLEYRMELVDLLSLSSTNGTCSSNDGEHVH